jgi:ADP-heptose:LPS heptosyltransferase/GT2 family glycosyltransferase
MDKSSPNRLVVSPTEERPTKPSNIIRRSITQNRPAKAHRVHSASKNPKLLLDVPPITSVRCAPYRVPEWFQTKDKAEVSVIVPMFKSGQVVKELINSWDLQNDGMKVETIYVDDCCPMNSKDVVITQWMTRKSETTKPIGKVIYSPENQGFGCACNIGARYATGDYLIFLNADTTVTPGWIRPIIRQLNKPDVGIVGNLQLTIKGKREMVESAGSEWNWDLLGFLHIGRDTYRGIRVNPFFVDNCPKDLFEVQEREMVTGACFGIRKSLFEELGGFNPNYRTAYWEDSDLCMTVKERGLKIIYQPNSKIYHLGRHTGASGHKYHEHNRNYFLNKWVYTGRLHPLVKAKRETPEVTNILIRRQAAHGDVLIAGGVAAALKKKYPDCKIIFSTLCTEVLEGNPYIDWLIEDKQLSERQFQVYFNLDMAYEYRPHTNILASYAEMVGVSPEDCKLYLKHEEVSGLPSDYIVVHPGKTYWAGRDWSSHKFEVLVSRLRKAGHNVVVVGTLADQSILCDADFRGKTNIPQLAGIIKKAKLFVGIDSFPMHIAQTFDVPGVAFFGSIKPSTRIINPKMRGVTAGGLPCLGCHHRQLPPCVSTSVCETQMSDCINQVSVDQMMRQIEDVLNTAI